jgi:thiol-disulfide isomerase/thioredoxin
MIGWAVLTIGAAVLAGCPSNMKGGGAGAQHPLERHPAPDVEVTMRGGGGAWHPSNANGKVLVLDFWATWCGPCKESFPRLDAVYQKHASRGLEVVGINEDEDSKGVATFVQSTGATFPIALDPNGDAASTFHVGTMPSEFVIDRHGVVRYVHSGYHPDDMDALDKEVTELLGEGD